MQHYVPEIVLWLFVINLGIACGAGLYEKRIMLPQWFPTAAESGLRVDSEAMRRTDTGRQFWAYVTTVPLTLLTLANLVVAWQAQGPRRHWWLGAAVMILIERSGTFSYFIPMALKLMHAETLSVSSVETIAAQWVLLNHVRTAFTLAGWLAALRAFSWPR
jgi:hypothetical protein